MQASVEAVEKLLQVPVDYFVKFNFGSFTKIVDGLDGIEVDVPVEFTEQNSKDEPDAIHLKKDYKIKWGRSTCTSKNAPY